MVRHDASVAESWIRGIQKTLDTWKESNPLKEQRNKYTLLDHKQLAGIWIAVFASDKVIKGISMEDIQSASIMTGWAGFAGNKGACAVRLR